MDIPDALYGNILNSFGDEGLLWLERLPLVVKECINIWELQNCHQAEAMTYSYVSFAKTEALGDVVLKISLPYYFETELIVMNLYNGQNICFCHKQDSSRGAMLLQRVLPGYDLSTLTNSHERIQTAADLKARLPVPMCNTHGLPTWSDLFKEFSNALAQASCNPKLSEMVKTADEMILILEESNRQSFLLHGDLYHWNILKGPNGKWWAIDPKGRVGAHCLEAGAFIVNELLLATPDNPGLLLDEITAVIGQRLDEPTKIIAMSAFIEKVMLTCQRFTQPMQGNINKDLQDCQLLLDYYTDKKNSLNY